MAQEYYSVEEAARKLGLPVDEVREMAKNPRDIRAFRDGSDWKFRAQDIDELARKRSLISDPDLGSGDSIHGDDSSILSADDMPVVIDEGALSGLGLGSSGKLSGSKSGSGSGPKFGSQPDSGTSISSSKKNGGSDPRLAFNDDDDVLFADNPVGGSPSDSDVKLSLDENTGFSGVLSSSKPKNQGPKTPAAPDLSVTSELGGPRTPVQKSKDLEATAAMNLDDMSFSDSDVGIDLSSSAGSSFDLGTSDPPKGSKNKSPKKDDFDEIKLGSSGELRLADSDEYRLESPSGVSRGKPNDSGIKLEDGDASSSSEFELSVDSTDSLPSFKDSDDDIVPPKKAGASFSASKSDELSAGDFELALDEDDSSAEVEIESGSEVVALDEEAEGDYDEAASDYEGYDDEPTSVGAPRAAAQMVAAEPAPWPGLLVLPLILTTVALCMGGIVVLETMRNAVSYQEGLPIAGTLANAEWLKSFAGMLGGK
jgi:excisionase family DNA binding protein